jgi:hypothetical protein
MTGALSPDEERLVEIYRGLSREQKRDFMVASHKLFIALVNERFAILADAVNQTPEAENLHRELENVVRQVWSSEEHDWAIQLHAILGTFVHEKLFFEAWPDTGELGVLLGPEQGDADAIEALREQLRYVLDDLHHHPALTASADSPSTTPESLREFLAEWRSRVWAALRAINGGRDAAM